MFSQIIQDLSDDLNQMNIDENFVKRASLLGSGTEAVIDWIDLAADLRQADKPYASLLVYEMSEKIFPKDRYLWNNRGVLLRFWERYVEAIRCFEKAIEIDPAYGRAKEGLAECFQRMHDFRKAVDAYEELFSFVQGYPQTWNNYAQCLKELNGHEDAIEAFKKSISLDQNYTEPYFNLAGLLNGMKRFGEALTIVDRLIALQPEDKQAIKLKEEILKKSKDPINLRQASTYTSREVYRLDKRPGSYEELQKLIEAGIENTVPPAAVPPSVFISYRWGTIEENEWVAKFASDLTGRGYEVILDQDIQSQRKDPLPVPDLVALMVKCNLFVPILTERYRRRVNTGIEGFTVEEDGWVYDEYQVALKLTKLNRLKLKGIWRSGPVVPLPFRADNVCDFRDDKNYENEMNSSFSRCMATITAFAFDGSQHTTGPIERVMIQTVGRELEKTGRFREFLITNWIE